MPFLQLPAPDGIRYHIFDVVPIWDKLPAPDGIRYSVRIADFCSKMSESTGIRYSVSE